MLPVAILSGGLATRLRPITDALPKALVPVADRPFVLRQLDYLGKQGVHRAVLCTGYCGEQIEAVVGDGSICGLNVEYSRDGDSLLGTGGAIQKALPILGREFFVLYGDSFLQLELSLVERAYHECDLPALLTVYHNKGKWDASNVLFEDGKVIEYSKEQSRSEMQYIDYGLAVLSANIFNCCPPKGAFDLTTLYHQLSISHQLAGYEVLERFYEIGSLEGLAETDEYFRLVES